MKLATKRTILAVALVGYIVCDFLLTPPAHIETRDPSRVTAVGVAALALLFVGLALSVVALGLLFRKSRSAPIAAIVAGVLFLPAPLTEVTDHFSSLRPPVVIAWVEVVQTAVAVIVVVIGALLLRRASAETN